MIKAIILDDEQHCVDSLFLDLERYCPEVHIVHALTSSKDCLTAIRKESPDLLFLDIEMPWMNGFELLDFLHPIDFEVIFVTAYDSYAVQAFRASAADYLMKPIDRSDLIDAVKKVKSRIEQGNSSTQIDMKTMLDNYFMGQKVQKIMLPDKDGQKFVELDSIMYVEAMSNYAKLHLINGDSILVTLTLKNIEQRLEGARFIRVHHSFIINMDHVSQYVRTDGGYLVMANQAKIPISRSRRSDIKEIIKAEFK